jgi:nucleoside-diphosphate-sugar epimerase
MRMNETDVGPTCQIVEARVQSKGRIRTCILFPGLIYGFGKGKLRRNMFYAVTDLCQDGRPSSWVTLYRDLAKAAGHVGTWGPGDVTQYCIHVRDVARAVLCVLDAQLQGKLSKDDNGLCKFGSAVGVMRRAVGRSTCG